MTSSLSEIGQKILIHVYEENRNVDYDQLSQGNPGQPETFWKTYDAKFGINSNDKGVFEKTLQDNLKKLFYSGHIEDIFGCTNPLVSTTVIKITNTGRESAEKRLEEDRKSKTSLFKKTIEEFQSSGEKTQKIIEQNGLFGIIKNLYLNIFVPFIFPVSVAIWFYWQNKTAIKRLIHSSLEKLHIF